jgi:hypothetical protein
MLANISTDPSRRPSPTSVVDSIQVGGSDNNTSATSKHREASAAWTMTNQEVLRRSTARLLTEVLSVVQSCPLNEFLENESLAHLPDTPAVTL